MHKKHKKSKDEIRREKLNERKEFDEEVKNIDEKLDQIQSNDYIDLTLTDEFNSLPILQSTKDALKKNKFHTMSPIQKDTLLYTLCGRDLIGSAETGSGKTLAFLIPIIEVLKKKKFSHLSGVGAIIISPTRDLAAQTYEVLAKLIKGTELSAALITGGMDFESERQGFQRLNILICTVGRLKEHMESSYTFDASNLHILVLDEADRLMNKEFMRDIKHILEDLPKDRQTLLFTATADKAIKKLTRLSLQRPIHINKMPESTTPDTLTQEYIVLELKEKWNFLFSFLKNNLSKKIIVFLETVKLVRFAFEAFCKLSPGLPVLHLTGKKNSQLRFETCKKFSQQVRAVIFTTDVIARGLDFPSVDYVVQLDCPRDIDTYIHRVGRTARFHKFGKSLLVLTKYEEPLIGMLKSAKDIEISQHRPNYEMYSITSRFIDVLSKNNDIKALAMKAISTYCKSVEAYQDRKLFNEEEFHRQLQEYTKSFGLLYDLSFDNNTDENDENNSVEVEDKKDDWFEIVEEDDDDFSYEVPTVKPATLVYDEPTKIITQKEYDEFRNYLRKLLDEDKPPKKIPKSKIKKLKGDDENEDKEDMEEEKEEEEEELSEESLARKILGI